MRVAARAIRIHRAPVFALWGTVIAERLGYNRDTALTLGHALAGLNDVPHAEAPTGVTEVELLGRMIPAVETPEGLRALIEKTPCSPALAERYFKNMFGDTLDEVRAGMERLARAYAPSELMQDGFKLYEAFRPEVPFHGTGVGQEEVLHPGRILALARLAER